MTDLLDMQVEAKCPACAATFKVSLRDVRDGRTVICPQGHAIHLQEQGDGIRQMERSLEDFKRSVERTNPNVKIRL